jgi:SAM-dependent methyltransferase
MTDTTGTEDAVVHGDELCIRDPGGEGRANIPTQDADHSPPADPDGQDRMLAPVADALLGAADLRPGASVLDVGCGCGATTLAAAATVGPTGTATGIDLTPAMLDVARGRLASSGLTNVELVLADAQTQSFPKRFDVVISRFGTMFFEDPVAAFVNLRRALHPGGRVVFVTWEPLEANAWLVIPGAALLSWIVLPDLDGSGPGMFAQSDPTVVTATLQNAGYTDIDVRALKVALTLGADATEAADRLADTGVGRAALRAVPWDQRPAALRAVRAALAEHERDSGIRLGAAVLLTTASRG